MTTFFIDTKNMSRIAFGLLLFLFLITGCKKDAPSSGGNNNKITVTTTAVTAIQQTSAISGGEVTGNTSGAVTEKGICLSTSSGPTITSTKISAGSGTGVFSSTISQLTSATTYYLRAYATTATETIYGNEQKFTTTAYQLASIVAQTVSSVKQTTAVSGAVISSAGGGNISAKGLCWSTNPNPTTADSKTVAGTGVASFNSQLTGLSAATTYYIRAYAVNEAGTAYSAAIAFTTLPVTVPTVDDLAVSVTNSNKITCLSNVSEDGGAPVTNRGFCIGLVANPTITTAGVFSNGTGIGPILAFISGFDIGTSYYIRAYATNSKGTSYSTQFIYKPL